MSMSETIHYIPGSVTQEVAPRIDKPEIVSLTDTYVAVSKPAGMLTLPDRHDTGLPHLKGWLQQRYADIHVVHRLDKDTSGLLLFARSAAAHQYYNQLFEDRQIDKYYLGLVHGQPLQAEGTLDAALAPHPTIKGLMHTHARGKESKTGYTVLQQWSHYSLVAFKLYTGRMHQIRVHCRHWGHPIVCDPLYGSAQPILLSSVKKKYKLSKNQENEQPIFNRLGLHSHRLVFQDMQSQPIALEAPQPKAFAAFMKQLDKWG